MSDTKSVDPAFWEMFGRIQNTAFTGIKRYRVEANEFLLDKLLDRYVVRQDNFDPTKGSTERYWRRRRSLCLQAKHYAKLVRFADVLQPRPEVDPVEESERKDIIAWVRENISEKEWEIFCAIAERRLKKLAQKLGKSLGLLLYYARRCRQRLLQTEEGQRLLAAD